MHTGGMRKREEEREGERFTTSEPREVELTTRVPPPPTCDLFTEYIVNAKQL